MIDTTPLTIIGTAHLITGIIEVVAAPSPKAFHQEHTGIHGGATHAASLQGAPPGEDIHPVFPRIGGGVMLRACLLLDQGEAQGVSPVVLHTSMHIPRKAFFLGARAEVLVHLPDLFQGPQAEVLIHLPDLFQSLPHHKCEGYSKFPFIWIVIYGFLSGNRSYFQDLYVLFLGN